MAIAQDRMEVRLANDEKALIEAAAHVRGLKVSAYARSVLLEESKQVLIEAQKANAIMLSRDESQRFMEALSAPFTANAKLAKAMERAKAA